MYYSHLSEVCLNFDQALDDADGLGVGQPGTMGQTMLGSLRELRGNPETRWAMPGQRSGRCRSVQVDTRRRWEWSTDKAQLL